MTMTTDFTQDLASRGFASPGDLVVQKTTKQLYKITKVMKVNYGLLDEDGREWKIKFHGVEAAPEGAVWSGPERGRNQERREERLAERVEAAGEFSVGDIVEMARDRDKDKFPGQYLIAKRTSPGRFALVGVGTGIRLTSPATLIKKA